MELVKYSGFVYEILTLLAWLTHTGSKKSCLSKRPAKAAQWGPVWGSGVVSLLRRRKLHTGPYRRDCGDYPALLPTGLRDFFFFWAHPQSPFLCLCGAVFIQEAPSFGPLIMFYKTLLGDMENLSFPFHCCDRMCFLKLLQNWPKLVLLWVWVLFLYLDQESLTQAHTAGHAGRSCLTFVPDAFFLCTSRDIFSICFW